jgi:RimJ/RimL family protein N-acetyltransferase
MLLRDVEPADLDVYVRMRCDPVMMAELGGPQPRERIPGQLRRDLRTAREDIAWIKMIVAEGFAHAAGTVTLYSEEETAFAGRVFTTNHWVYDPPARG